LTFTDWLPVLWGAVSLIALFLARHGEKGTPARVLGASCAALLAALAGFPARRQALVFLALYGIAAAVRMGVRRIAGRRSRRARSE
jgi:hypothetical protein